MKKYFVLLFALMLGTSVWADGKLQVIISAGQSNADGRAYLSEGLPSYMQATQQNLQFANVTLSSPTAFHSRLYDKTQEGNRFSFADVAAWHLANQTTDDVFHIKCAYGGTAIALGQTAEKLPFWNASEAYLDTARVFTGKVGNGTSLAMSLVAGVKSLAENVLSQRSEGYDVKAILWHQGESDRKAYASYYKNLGDLISYLRKEIYAVTGDEADLTLPFIMGTISKASTQYNTKIEEAQRKLADDMENVYVIDLADAELRSDKLHFNADWTEYFGMKAYNEMVDVAGVSGEKVSTAKPDGDVIQQQVDVKPLRQWNFAKDNWSEASTTAIAANWAEYNSGYGYRNKAAISNATLTAGDYVIPETDGLLFNVTKGSRLGLHPTAGALCFIGTEATVTVPQVQPGQFIYVKGRTANTKNNRGIVATTASKANLDVLAGDTISTGVTESIYWVQDSYTSPVDASFTCQGGQSYLYEISVWDVDPRNTVRNVKQITLPNEYNTYTATRNLDFTDNDTVAAYSAKLNSDGTAVTLTRVYKVKKGEGLVLKRLMDVASACVVVGEEADALTDNQLYGVLDDTPVSTLLTMGTIYGLVDQHFCPLASTATGTLPAGKAVLVLPADFQAKNLDMVIAGGEATGISTLDAQQRKGSDAIYNLNGQRIATPQSGQIYIVNGKKIMY